MSYSEHVWVWLVSSEGEGVAWSEGEAWDLGFGCPGCCLHCDLELIRFGHWVSNVTRSPWALWDDDWKVLAQLSRPWPHSETDVGKGEGGFRFSAVEGTMPSASRKVGCLNPSGANSYWQHPPTWVLDQGSALGHRCQVQSVGHVVCREDWITSPFICWSPNSQCDCVWRQHL